MKILLALALSVRAGALTAQTVPPPGGGALMRADADHDGVITKAEMVAEADARFAAIDTDHDGSLSAAEMQASRDAMRQRMARRAGTDAPPPPPPPGMPKMGKRMDPNGDGAVTRAEYEARAAARFDRLDANHDGRIDRTELANIAERMRERRDPAGAAMTPPPPSPGE